jgi:hypothetical protein
MERYYVKVSGATGSVVPHDTLAAAYSEAQRLFGIHGKARRVYVLQAIGALEPEAVESVEHIRHGRVPCPACGDGLYGHGTIDWLYRCRNAECAEFDRWASLRRGADHA